MPVGQTDPVIRMTTKDSVDTPSVLYGRMSELWPVIDDVYGGTRSMRAAGDRWLPQHPEEESDKYDRRLQSTFLYNALADTINNVVSKPFSKDVQVQNLPEGNALESIELDVDRCGMTLSEFARQVMLIAIKYGLVHILVDSPRMPAGATMADERAAKARPFLVAISPKDLIGWKFATDKAGAQRLVQIRYRETAIEADGTYADKEVHRVRVYGEHTWELHVARKNDKGQTVYVLEDEGIHTFNGGPGSPPEESQGVPLVTIYFEKDGQMLGCPPLEDLAWLNVEHWQSSSDQRNILRISRVGCFWATGINDEEFEKIKVAPTNFWKSENTEAKFGVAEHTGAAAKIGDDDLKRIEERMITIGIQLFLRRTGSITATGSAIDASKSDSTVLQWVRSLEMGLERAYDVAARWIREELPDDFSIDVYSDFEITMRASGDIQSLIAMREKRQISRETFLREVKKRGILSESVDVNEEIDRLDSEPPELAMIGRFGDGEGGDDGEGGGDGGEGGEGDQGSGGDNGNAGQSGDAA